MAKKKSTTRKKTTAKGQQASGKASKAAAGSGQAGGSSKASAPSGSKKKTTRTSAASSSTKAASSKKKQSGTSRSKSASRSGSKKAGGATRSKTPPAPPAPVPGTPSMAVAATDPDRFNGQQLSDEQLRKVKTGLTRKELEEFRKLLLEKRAELIGDVESLQKDARNEDASISYEHMADVGTDSYEQEFTLGLVESERKLLREIDEALERISKGTFGVCVVSGEPIGKPRLEAKPWAKHSIEVARERERRGLG